MKGKKSNITENILKSYFEGRLGVIMDTVDSYKGDLHAPRLKRLMRENLRFAERVLSEDFGPYYYELSVFVNADSPEIICYYDSAGHDNPRSQFAREKDAQYYRKKRYAVVQILESPTPQVMVVPFTKKSDYCFSDASQLAAIGSTIIYCFAPEIPGALVIVCDRGGTFSEKNPRLVTFVRSIGLSLLVDIEFCRKCTSNLQAHSSPPPTIGKTINDYRTFSWIHLSDMHFGAGDTTHRFEQSDVMKSILNDIKDNATKPFDRIFLTGDIAFSGKKIEYEEAYSWLRSLAKVSGASMARIRIVPGNHDVRRPTQKVGGALAIHDKVRKNPKQLNEELNNTCSRRQLLEKLKEYRKFVNNFKKHTPASPLGVDWIEHIHPTKGNGYPAICIIGLSTVWVSDQLDGRQMENGNSPFVPNMLVSTVQIAELFRDVREDEIVLILSHHTPEWLVPESNELLTSTLSHYRHVHLCGHVHNPIAYSIKRFGLIGTGIRFVAGAAHNDASEAQKHGYIWGMIKYDTMSKSLKIGWSPRTYVRDRKEMRADATRYKLDQQGFTWENLPLIS